MTTNKDLIWKSLELILRSPCCCRYCDRRANVLKELGLSHELIDGGILFRRDHASNVYLIVLDDPGCYASRTITSWGTIFTCYGLYEEYPKLIVRAYSLDYEYTTVDELILRQVNGRISYYYSRREYMERSLIAVPYPTRIPYTISVHDVFQPESIISQAIGVTLAVQRSFNIILAHTSTIFFLKHILASNVPREAYKILIVPYKAVKKYNIIETVVEKLNAVSISIECRNESLTKCMYENYSRTLKIIEELSL